MPRIERSAHVTWEGNVARGVGHISGDTGAFTELPFSLPTRIGAAEGKTSPEELLAAAHGGCITMSLASELTQAGTPPEKLDVRTLIVMDEVEGQGHQIVGSHVEMTASADGLDDAALQSALARADEGCPFSQLLKRAGVDVQVTATLA
ncbi:MAG: OsmC family peroxiredoxin [Actinomycetota bacterium]